jgi:glycosyltransferase involved in cell wall biosynthesis
MTPINVAAFTGNGSVPSARFRVRQYIPALSEHGVAITEMPSRFGKYPPEARWPRPFWLAGAVTEQLPLALKSRRFDAVLLQREIVSTLVTVEPLTGKPRILDVDDAIFLFRGGRTARRLAQLADRIVCGNSFLAETFAHWNPRVTILPTGIDTERYVPAGLQELHDTCVIGWIGSFPNLPQLLAIEAPLARLLRDFPHSRLRVVCDRMIHLPQLPADRVEYIPWSEAGEVRSIQTMSIGIMPLRDSMEARGKCSFKMIQYMACGLPSVVSPVGMNADVLAMGHFALGATGPEQWFDALSTLVADADLRRKMGAQARRVAQERFSVAVLAPKLADLVRSVRG